MSLILIAFLAGFGGALLRNIVKNNSLVMPKFENGNLILGFIGCGVTGGAVALATGGDGLTGFLAGYTGMSLISKVMPQEVLKNEKKEETITEIIERVCREENVNPALALRVAKCESSLNPTVTGKNKDGSLDRGLFQINSKWHPEVAPEDAFDPEFSTHFFCRQFKAGRLSDWNASKTCWIT